MRRIQSLFRRFANWFAALSQRERVILSAVALLGVIYSAQQVTLSFQEYVDTNSLLVSKRTAEYESIAKTLKRYQSLKRRRETLQATFAASQMTYEQVVNQLSKLVRDTIGNDNFELKKSRSPAPFGLDFQKQEFTLSIKAISMEQLVKILYQIEQGERPLFLSKVDITRLLQAGDYSANLEIYSINKSGLVSTDA